MNTEENMPFKAKFWHQLRATLIRNVLRKKRNKRHMMKVNITSWTFSYVKFTLKCMMLLMQ